MPTRPNNKRDDGVENPPVVLRNAQRKVRVDTEKLAEFARRAWRACDRVPAKRPWPSGEISVVLVSDRTIAALHKQFMAVGGPTDVITFQHGDIVISAETAARQAREYRSSLGRELRLYIVHGFLHLRGHNDDTPSGARKMQRLQRSVLRRLSS